MTWTNPPTAYWFRLEAQKSERWGERTNGFNLCGYTFYWQKLVLSIMFLQSEETHWCSYDWVERRLNFIHLVKLYFFNRFPQWFFQKNEVLSVFYFIDVCPTTENSHHKKKKTQIWLKLDFKIVEKLKKV